MHFRWNGKNSETHHLNWKKENTVKCDNHPHAHISHSRRLELVYSLTCHIPSVPQWWNSEKERQSLELSTNIACISGEMERTVRLTAYVTEENTARCDNHTLAHISYSRSREVVILTSCHVPSVPQRWDKGKARHTLELNTDIARIIGWNEKNSGTHHLNWKKENTAKCDSHKHSHTTVIQGVVR